MSSRLFIYWNNFLKYLKFSSSHQALQSLYWSFLFWHVCFELHYFDMVFCFNFKSFIFRRIKVCIFLNGSKMSFLSMFFSKWNIIQGDHYKLTQKLKLTTFILIKNWLFSPTSPLLQIWKINIISDKISNVLPKF